MRRENTCCCAGSYACEDIFGCNRVLTFCREAERAHKSVREFFKHENERTKQLDHHEGWTNDGHGSFFGFGDSETLGKQVGKDNEEECGKNKGDDEVDAVNLLGYEHKGETPFEKWGKCGLTDDATEKCKGVRTDLNGGEELTRVFLQVKDESGTAIAFVSKYVETGSAGGGKGDFSATQISAEADESEKKEQLCVNRHKAEQEFEELVIVT